MAPLVTGSDRAAALVECAFGRETMPRLGVAIGVQVSGWIDRANARNVVWRKGTPREIPGFHTEVHRSFGGRRVRQTQEVP